MRALAQRSLPLLAALLLPLAGGAGCAHFGGHGAAEGPSPVLNLAVGDPARRDRTVDVVLDGVLDTRTGVVGDATAMARGLADARIVLVGESHTSPVAHEVELRTIQALVASGRKVVLGLEMLPVAAQPALDRWSSGQRGEGANEAAEESAFLRAADWYTSWGFRFAYYREIFRFAREQRLPIFGLNVPREVVTAVRKKGFDHVEPAQARLLPPKLDQSSEEHKQLFVAYFGPGDPSHGPGTPGFSGMYTAQCTWDATMAWNATRALAKPELKDAVMVILVGEGHVAYGLGIARQARQWTPDRVATVLPVPARDPGGKPSRVRASYADYVWGVPADAPDPFPSLGASLAEGAQPDGVKVTDVSAGSAAARAGVHTDDRIVAIDGAPMKSKSDVMMAFATTRWGDEPRFKITRAGQPLELPVPLRRSATAQP